jgi:hypothetical protein
MRWASSLSVTPVRQGKHSKCCGLVRGAQSASRSPSILLPFAADCSLLGPHLSRHLSTLRILVPGSLAFALIMLGLLGFVSRICLREEWRRRGSQRELLLQGRGKRAGERLCEGCAAKCFAVSLCCAYSVRSPFVEGVGAGKCCRGI